MRGFVQFFASSARHIQEGTRSSFTLPSTDLASLRHPTSIQKCPNNNNYQDIATISAIFTRHSTSLHDGRNRTFTLTYENDDHSGSVEHVAPRHARITLWALRLRYSSAPSAFAPLQRRHSESLCGTTPTKPRRAERVRTAAPRITLLRLRYSAALSAFAQLHPASLCSYYAYDTPPH